MASPVTPGWLGGRHVTELCEGACLWWRQLVTLALVEAAILVSRAGISAQSLGQGSRRRECKQWFWSVMRRCGRQDSSGRFRPMFPVKKDKDPPL